MIDDIFKNINSDNNVISTKISENGYEIEKELNIELNVTKGIK